MSLEKAGIISREAFLEPLFIVFTSGDEIAKPLVGGLMGIDAFHFGNLNTLILGSLSLTSLATPYLLFEVSDPSKKEVALPLSIEVYSELGEIQCSRTNSKTEPTRHLPDAQSPKGG